MHEAEQVEQRVLEVEMHHVRGDQPPPLAGRDGRAVVAQSGARRIAGELGQQQEHADDDEQRQPVTAVAVERRKQRFEPVHR